MIPGLGKSRGKEWKPQCAVLLNECPEVIGMMTIALDGGGSLDAAVRDVARSGPEQSRTMFGKVVDEADTRVNPNIRMGLISMAASLPDRLAPYALAIRMMVSASDAPDSAERNRLTGEAREIALNGLREAGKMYSSGLNAPCMMIFGVGIMVPMVLMTILPMLQISGMFGPSGLDSVSLTVITLVLIPAFIAIMMAAVKNGNPFVTSRRFVFDARTVLPLMISVPLAASLMFLTGLGASEIVAVSVSVPCAITFLVLFRERSAERETERIERLLKESVFDMGNYLLSGMSFENAFRSAAGTRKDCGRVAERLSAEMTVCRGDTETAIRNAIAPVSPYLSGIFVEIWRASLKNIRDSGRLAQSLGKQILDQDAVRRGIRSDMKGMTDTMSMTASVFAPLVLGLSVTILEPMSRVSESTDIAGTSLILSVYLVELCALISCLLTFLDGRNSFRDAVRRFSGLCAVSLLVFAATSMIGFRRRRPFSERNTAIFMRYRSNCSKPSACPAYGTTASLEPGVDSR